MVVMEGSRDGGVACTFVHVPRRCGTNAQYLDLRFPPTWAYTLAAHLEAVPGIRLALIEDGEEPPADTDVFLYSGWNQDRDALLAVRGRLACHAPTARHALGGPIAWSFDQAGTLGDLAAFDHVFIGDGEEQIATIVTALWDGRAPGHVLRAPARFDLARALPMHAAMVSSHAPRNDCAIVEVSRGCPYRCEFCDIPAQAGGGRTRGRPPEVVVADLDRLCRLGFGQVLLVADNLAGDLRHAREVVDAIVAWRRRSGFTPSLFTWATLDVHRRAELLHRMRLAGIDTLFVGIESFSIAVLERAGKRPNARACIPDAVARIQSYGFVVVPGLVFGLDGETGDAMETVSEGLRASGLLAGDPGFVVALPGTPLHERLRASGRLRPLGPLHNAGGFRSNARLSGSRRAHVDGYLEFMSRDLSGRERYARLRAFLRTLESDRYVASRGASFGALVPLLMRHRTRAQLLRRLLALARRPRAALYAIAGVGLALSRTRIRGRCAYVGFWIYAWTTALVKYGCLSAASFDIEGTSDACA